MQPATHDDLFPDDVLSERNKNSHDMLQDYLLQLMNQPLPELNQSKPEPKKNTQVKKKKKKPQLTLSKPLKQDPQISSDSSRSPAVYSPHVQSPRISSPVIVSPVARSPLEHSDPFAELDALFEARREMLQKKRMQERLEQERVQRQEMYQREWMQRQYAKSMQGHYVNTIQTQPMWPEQTSVPGSQDYSNLFL